MMLCVESGQPGQDIEAMRTLSPTFEILSENKMGELADHCRSACAGLEELFFSSLKIHNSNSAAGLSAGATSDSVNRQEGKGRESIRRCKRKGQ
jgi:hypothetical protein